MRKYYINLLLLFILGGLSACQEKIVSTLPIVAPDYLSMLPGALIYNLDSKDCSQRNAICREYLLKTGNIKPISNNLIATYNKQYDLQNNFETSPNKRYTIQWNVVDEKGVLLYNFPANRIKQPIIVDRQTGHYHLV